MSNRALQGAYRKGAEARAAGKPKSACPYRDVRTDYHNFVTFSRAFLKMWHEGWDDKDREMKKV